MKRLHSGKKKKKRCTKRLDKHFFGAVRLSTVMDASHTQYLVMSRKGHTCEAKNLMLG